ncbi:M23 family metallopeptidase [Phaeobacter sp. HF9A]|nr:M23 family metallopeptidase [Phaeobacter sp. HF9A]NIZ14844.1 M23 family metallopeptidase [Phaeobacter sp. HF9A]
MLRISAVAITLATPAVASELQLDWPVDCALGESCHIQQYVDHDPGPAATDFTCGALSYDGHKGTDIALPSRAAMLAGVSVRAAADGVVAGVRDGMPDTGPSDISQVKGRECGNGVVLRHSNGWETQYCHMKRGSITVQKGETVTSGAPLGQVGLSGLTEFPHLHLSVRHKGAVVDPFTPKTPVTTCGGDSEATLWRDAPAYVEAGLISLGFATDVPQYDAIKAGTANQAPLASDSPALVLWVYGFGSAPGDVLSLRITGPAGETIYSGQQTLERQQSQYFRAAGKRLHAPLAPGRYTGVSELRRAGQRLDRREIVMTLPEGS